MVKKILAWVLVASLTATLAIGGTLAYLTDRDSEANVFTVGDVNINLNEEFHQGSTLIPGVNIEKKPTITNLGPNNAWVWATVAVPANLADVIDFSGEGTGWETWTKDENITEIDGKDYALFTILHSGVLGVNDVTEVLFSKVGLDNTVDIDPNGQWHTVDNGTNTNLGWNSSNGAPTIYVSAYAIQADGFSSVADAYAAYNTQWGDNGAEYAPATEVIDTPTELEDALNAGTPALLGADIVLDEPLSVSEEVYIDLNGHTLSASNLELKAGGTISNGIFRSDKDNTMLPHLKVNGNNVTLENLTVYITHYMNYGEGMTGGSCVELSGVDVIDGSLVLNNCDLNVTNDSAYDETFLYGISVNNGNVTMNGGSIVFNGIFGSKIHCNAVVSGMGTSVVNLNNVNIQNGNCYISYGGNLTINTNVSSMETMQPVSFGGQYTLNYNP